MSGDTSGDSVSDSVQDSAQGGQLGESSGLAPEHKPQPAPGGVREDVPQPEAVTNENFGEQNLSADERRPEFWSGATDENAQGDAGEPTGGNS